MEYSAFHRCEDGNGIRDSHKLSEIADKFIIQRDDTRKYIILESLDDYIEYQETLKHPIFHELILCNKPRKFFLDLDFKVRITDIEDYNNRLLKYEEHIKGIKDMLVAVFNTIYISETLGIEDILEVVSHMDINEYLRLYKNDPELKYKFSMNLIIDKFLFPDQCEFASFGMAVLDKYKKLSKINIIDEKFFKNRSAVFIQNRIIFSTKVNELRYKYPRIDGVVCTKPSRELFMRYILQDCNISGSQNNLRLLTSRFNTERSKSFRQIKAGDISNKFIADVLSKTEDIWKDAFVPRMYDESRPVLMFDRIPGIASYCEFCNETHHKDNNLYFFITDDRLVFAKCHQKKDGSKLIYSPEWYDENVVENQVHIQPTAPINVSKSKEWFTPLEDIGANIHIETEPVITSKAFTNDDFLLIKAEMKMGKSKALIKHITEFDSNFKKIVFISFRRTFSSEAKKKYSSLGFKSYNDIVGLIDTDEHNRMIIQVESLSRIKFPIKDIDLLILDEMESIWSQISSNNFRDYYGSYNVFQLLLETSRQVIAMDANLSIRTSRLIARICKDRNPKSINVYINRHNPNADTEFYIVDKFYWVAQMSKVAPSCNIAVFSNSLKEAKIIKNYLISNRYMTKDKIKLYGSKTKESTKQKHFSNVDEYWSKYRCVICTPTVSAGVSFEVSHFDYVFGYFTDKSCNVETCRQMLGRVRNISSKKVYITLSTCADGKYMTDLRDIKLALSRNRTELVEKYGSNVSLLNFKIDNATGHCSYEDNLQLNIILENIAFDNRSRNRFSSIMSKQLSGEYNKLTTKSQIYYSIVGISYATVDTIKAAYTKCADQTRKTLIENIVKSENIDREKYSEIIEKSRNMIDITSAEHLSIEKYKIQLATRLNYDLIDKKIVDRFGKKHNQRALNANRQIFAGESWDESITLINEMDAKNYSDINNRSKDTIMFKGKIHLMVRNICKMFTYHNSPNGIDLLTIVKSRFELPYIGANFNEDEIYNEIITIMPMIDIPYTEKFTIGGKSENISIIEFITVVMHILRVVYGFRYKSDSGSYNILPMKSVIYIHGEGRYLNGREYSGDDPLPEINIKYSTCLI